MDLSISGGDTFIEVRVQAVLGKYPPSPWRLAAKFATKRRVYGRVCFKTPADVQVPGTGKSNPGQPKDQVKGKMA